MGGIVTGGGGALGVGVLVDAMCTVAVGSRVDGGLVGLRGVAEWAIGGGGSGRRGAAGACLD